MAEGGIWPLRVLSQDIFAHVLDAEGMSPTRKMDRVHLFEPPLPELSPGHHHEGNRGLQPPEAAALAGRSFILS